MSTSIRFLLPLAVAAAVAAPAVAAQSCKPDVQWQHEHAGAKADTATTDVKGSRATRIEVCRADAATAAGVKVEVQFEGSREAVPLVAGDCVDRFSKWAVIRSHGAKSDAGAAAVSGLYRVCRE